ncbi:hypothetical protein [Megalodesulfovibrio gigas]|uniref:Uncharacterized protein n=1 Tax=Megalodesulfovibrio gigas (strain ATCC 19364 / DSM 1382 / NCIMB 9332 / VKM B-1759) TaxID=1121448 RepID=T2G8E2_MEGG1|nr:hypothetical protein [Megalodesulfovibrio gigas]AGW12152.1 hypothetical protein DGI_0218 [Megalodesulfovibrio gigas DSM 1382 = ATCC 19364]
MSDRDLRDLWDAIDVLRTQQHVANTLLAEIKTILSERCEGRGRRIQDLEAGLEQVRARVWWFAGASSAAAFVVSRLWPSGFGK